MVLFFKWLLTTSNTPATRLTSFNRQLEVLILVFKTPKNQKKQTTHGLQKQKTSLKCSILSLPETNIALTP